MVQMLKRNMSIKNAPQRWQDNQDHFDVVIVFDERLMDNLLEGQQPCASSYGVPSDRPRCCPKYLHKQVPAAGAVPGMDILDVLHAYG